MKLRLIIVSEIKIPEGMSDGEIIAQIADRKLEMTRAFEDDNPDVENVTVSMVIV